MFLFIFYRLKCVLASSKIETAVLPFSINIRLAGYVEIPFIIIKMTLFLSKLTFIANFRFRGKATKGYLL